MRNKKILITGGLGFVGQALARKLKDTGNHVKILDDLSNASLLLEMAEEAGFEVVVGDIEDQQLCDEVCFGQDVVVHLAAQTYVAKSVEEPHIDLTTNGIGTLNMLESSCRSGVKVFVAASSNAVSGNYPPPFNEGASTRPLSPYGCSKLLVESYLHAYAHTRGMRTVALRFSNVYGPGSWRKGSVVASFIRNILSNSSVTIYGDGNQTRDFIHVDDIATAITCSIERAPPGSCYCIGSGQRTAILSLAIQLQELAKDFSGISVEFVHDKPRLGDIRENWSDITFAKRDLQFNPVTALSVGLGQTYEWFLENSDKILPGN